MINLFLDMKKSIYIVLVAAAITACTKEMPIQKPDNNLPEGPVASNIFTLTVSTETTKAIINAADNISFKAGEALAIVASDNSIIRTLVAESDGTTVRFSGDIGDKTINDGALIVYPESFLTSATQVTYPTNPTVNDPVPMAGKIDKSNGSVTLKHLGGIVKIAVSNVPFIANTLSFTADTNITGTFTIGWSGTTPTLSGESDNATVTYAISGGDNWVYVPIPSISCTSLRIDVGDGSNTYFTKSKEITYGGRASYLGMQTIPLTAEVYAVGDYAGAWYDDITYLDRSNEIKFDQSGSTYSTEFSSTSGNKYYHLVYYFPNGSCKFYELGPAVNGVNSGQLQGRSRSDNVALIVSDAGTHTVSFESSTGVLSYTKTSSIPTYYVTNNWALDRSRQMVSCATKGSSAFSRAYYLGTLYTLVNSDGSAGFKLYDCASWKNAIGASSEVKSDSDATPSVGTSSKNLFVANPGNVYLIVYGQGYSLIQKFDLGTVSDLTETYTPTPILKGDFDSWSEGHEMTADATYKQIFTYDLTVASSAQVKVKDGENWYGYDNGDYRSDATSEGGDKNLGLDAGTWRIIYNASTKRINLFKVL